MADINYTNYFWQQGSVRLRSLEKEDSKNYYLSRFNTEDRNQLAHGVELPPTISEAEDFINEYINLFQTGEAYMFAIENLQGENVGLAELNSIDEKNGTFSIGIQIYKSQRKKGYGSSAAKILLNYAFFERRLNKLNACIIEGNEAGAIFLEKLGCLKECVRTEMFYINGSYVSELYYGLLKDEFQLKIE